MPTSRVTRTDRTSSIAVRYKEVSLTVSYIQKDSISPTPAARSSGSSITKNKEPMGQLITGGVVATSFSSILDSLRKPDWDALRVMIGYIPVAGISCSS